jgi:hypothetical protein
VWVRPPSRSSSCRRAIDQLPAPPGTYPEGWYKVAFSEELEPAGAVSRRYFGQTIEISRTHEGIVRATVSRGEARVPTSCAESGGLVMLWWGRGEPRFPPPDYRNYEVGGRVRRAFSEVVNSPLWDVAENPFDYAHLRTVHRLDLLAEPTIELEGASLHLRFDARTLSPVGPESLGRLIRVSTHVRCFGLGLTDTHVHSRRIVSTVWIVGCNTPVDEHHTEYTLIFCSAPGVDARPLRALIFRLTSALTWKATEVERVVWRRKRYLKRPCLTKPERGVMSFRRWARQFECV